MKIKSSKDIDMKKLLILWIAGAAALVGTRIYQMFSIINHKDGFYTQTDFSVIIMYVLIAVLAVIFVAGSFLSSKANACENNFSDNKALGGAAFLVAASMLVNVIIQGGAFLELYKDFDLQFGVTTMTLPEYLMKSGALSKFGESIFGATSAVYFLMLGFSCFNKKFDVSKFKILAVTPVIWAIFRMLTRLIRTISYIKVSDLFYEILMLLFMMLFFMAFAQLNSKINEDGIKWKLFGYGFTAALLGLVCSVPRLIYSFSGGELSADAPIEIWDLFLAIFIVVYLVSLMRKKSVTEE